MAGFFGSICFLDTRIFKNQKIVEMKYQFKPPSYITSDLTLADLEKQWAAQFQTKIAKDLKERAEFLADSKKVYAELQVIGRKFTTELKNQISNTVADIKHFYLAKAKEKKEKFGTFLTAKLAGQRLDLAVPREERKPRGRRVSINEPGPPRRNSRRNSDSRGRRRSLDRPHDRQRPRTPQNKQRGRGRGSERGRGRGAPYRRRSASRDPERRNTRRSTSNRSRSRSRTPQKYYPKHPQRGRGRGRGKW